MRTPLYRVSPFPVAPVSTCSWESGGSMRETSGTAREIATAEVWFVVSCRGTHGDGRTALTGLWGVRPPSADWRNVV